MILLSNPSVARATHCPASLLGLWISALRNAASFPVRATAVTSEYQLCPMADDEVAREILVARQSIVPELADMSAYRFG